MINGFPIITTSDNTMIGTINVLTGPATICMPSATKKMVTKKSLNGFSLLLSSSEYGVLASVTPATNAPITAEKSSAFAMSASPNAHDNPARKSSSTDFETFSRTRGITKTDAATATTKNATIFPLPARNDPSEKLPMLEKKMSAKIATISCTSSTPSAIRACNVSISFLSINNLTTTTVLDSDSAIAI